MYLHKKTGKEHIDPESWEWLFDHGFIQLVVDVEGNLDILITAKGVRHLRDEENNPGFFHQPELFTVPDTGDRHRDWRMYVLLSISLFILFGCILYNKIKG